MRKRKQIKSPDPHNVPSEPSKPVKAVIQSAYQPLGNFFSRDEEISEPEFDAAFEEAVKRRALEADISRYENWTPASLTEDVHRQNMLSKLRQQLAQLLGEIPKVDKVSVPAVGELSEMKQPIAVFPRIEGLTWEQVIMTFMSDEAIKVEVGRIKKKFHFAEIGFKDGRKGDVPDSRWGILRIFAQLQGEIDWESKIDVDRKEANRYGLKEAIKVIRKRLRAFMQIADDPLFPYRQFRMYKTRFVIRLANPEAYARRDELADQDEETGSNYDQADASESDQLVLEDAHDDDKDDSES